MKKIIFLFIVSVLFTCLLGADYYIKTKIEMKMEPQVEPGIIEDQPTIIDIWLGDNYMLANFNFSDTVPFYYYLNLSEKKQYVVSFSEKAYYELPSVHKELDKELTDEKVRKFEESLEKYTTKLEVKRIEGKRKIGEWLCTGYRIEHNQTESLKSTREIWITKDVPFDWRVFDQIQERLFSEKMIQLKGYLDSRYNYPEIEGFEIENISTTINGEKTYYTISRVVEISEKNPPEMMHNFPKGFKKIHQ